MFPRRARADESEQPPAGVWRLRFVVPVTVVVVALGAALAGAGVLTRAVAATGSGAAPVTSQEQGMKAGAEFAEPPRAETGDGEDLAITLEASRTRFDLSGKQVGGESFNGSFTAPTIHADPGTTVSITLHNRLPVATNLHFHGLHVSPEGNSDNPFLCIPPGASFAYKLAIPADHPQGTYWYHSHAMSTSCPQHGMNGMQGMNGTNMPGSPQPSFTPGDVENQIYAGLSGALVIGDDRSLLPRALQDVPARTIVLKDAQTDTSGNIVQNTKTTSIDSNAPTARLVNGQFRPVLAMRAGQTELWRLVNAGADIFYKLQLDGYRFTVIGEDGNPAARSTDTGQLLLPPGKRYDVLVTAGTAPATTWLRTLAYSNGPQGDAYPDTALMQVNTTTNPTENSAPEKSAPEKTGGNDGHRDISAGPAAGTGGFAVNGAPADLAGTPVAQHRALELSEDASGTGFFINGRQFAMDQPTFSVAAKLGTVEEWTITNASGEDHPFHMHSNPFQVMSVNGVPVPYSTRQDTVVVPHAVNGVPGRVVLRQQFTDYPGKWMFHCHIAAHEDRGMMGYITVTP